MLALTFPSFYVVVDGANASLRQVRNYVTQSDCLRSPMGSQSKPGNYVITAEPWCANSIYDQFTTTATVDEIINMNTSKAQQKAKN